MQYIPGTAELLGPAIDKFMQGLNHAIDPNYNLREAVKAQIAVNPELLQNLANAEAKAPGTLSALGLGKLGETIAGTPADTTTQTQIDSRQQIIDTNKKKIAAEGATADVTRKKAAATSTALDNPATAQLAGQMGATGITPWDQATGEQRMQYVQLANNIIKDGTQVTLDKLKKGEYTNEQLVGIFSSPLGEALGMMQRADEEKWRRALMARQITADNALMRLKEAQAFKLFQDTRQGSIDAYLKLLNDPNATEEAKRLAALPRTQLTAEQAQLVDSYNGIQNLDAAQKAQQTASINKNIESAILSYRTIKPNDANSDELRKAAATTLTQAFESRSQLLGTPNYTVSFETVPKDLLGVDWLWPDKKALVYRDASGKVVPESQALNGFSNSPNLEALVGQTISELNKVRGDKAKFDAALKQVQEMNPEVYAAVIQRLNGGR